MTAEHSRGQGLVTQGKRKKKKEDQTLIIVSVIPYKNDLRIYKNVVNIYNKTNYDYYQATYAFIGDGEKWEGYMTKIKGYYNFLVSLKKYSSK